ncbi:MAG: hypothetical protein WBG90_09865 [Saonia sp.]
MVARIILALFACLSISGHAQQVIHYRDTLQVGKYVGMADFHYKVLENDTLLNGPFQMQRSSLEALLEKGDYSFSFTGAFKDNYPEGYWKFQFGEFQSDSVTQVVDYQYRLNITGTQEVAEGALINGRPDGEWTIITDHIKDSEVDKTLFKSVIEFDNGLPQKSFRIINENSTLIGRFLRNGLAHDEWTLFSENDLGLVESWDFTDGRLKKVEIREDGESKVVNLYVRAINNEKIINLNAQYLTILKIKQQSSDTSNLSESLVYGLLTENALYYKKIDDILSQLGESAFLPEFKVKVPYFPLDSIESAQLDSTKVLYRKSKKISESLLNNTQLNILKLADDEAQFLYSIVGAISAEFLDPVGNILEYHEQDILEYVSRDELIAHVWPNEKPSVAIVVGKNGSESESFRGPKAAQFNFDGSPMVSIQQITQYAAGSLDSIQQVLNTKLIKEKRQQEFIALEEQMIAQVNQLNHDLDSLTDGLPEPHTEALKQIRSTANQNLIRYSKMKETDAKRELGRRLVRCFEQMDTLAIAIALQPSRMKEIQDKYQDAVWNPFMATIMNEEVKKRIISAYRKVLVPYILNSTTSNLNCDKVGEQVSLLDKAYQRMLEMRDEDTSKLERKLKKERDPLVVIQLFNLEPTGETEK